MRGQPSGNGFNEFGVRAIDLMRDGQFHSLTDRLEFDRALRITFRFQLRPEFVAPFETRGRLGRIDLDDFAAVGDTAIGENHLPRRAGLPIGLVMHAEPIFSGELRTGQRRP